MKFSFELVVRGTKESVWEYYKNIEKWYVWEPDLIDLSFDGAFETGTLGKMTLEGMPPLAIELTSVVENKEFFDKSTTPMGDIIFGHEIIDGFEQVIIKHSVALEKNEIEERDLEFLSQTFKGVPKSMFLLKKAVEEK